MDSNEWIQKIETFFELNHLAPGYQVKMVVLHLAGDTHNWWHHGKFDLGHRHVTKFLDFTSRFFERFDKGFPHKCFWELKQLKQNGSPEAYNQDFLKLLVRVHEVSQ